MRTTKPTVVLVNGLAILLDDILSAFLRFRLALFCEISLYYVHRNHRRNFETS